MTILIKIKFLNFLSLFLGYKIAVNSKNKFVRPSDESASKIIPVFLKENHMTYFLNSNKTSMNRYYNMIIENLTIIDKPPFVVSLI